MIRRLYRVLPGSPTVKAVLIVLVVLVALVLLGLLFEWAGQFLDTGGTIALLSFQA
ncbi:MAG: hypothetical protein WAM81_05130 [Acidimicrobiia bacterium]